MAPPLWPSPRPRWPRWLPATPAQPRGLVNVSQQIGAALGLAVLVTIFDALTGHAQLQPGTGSSAHAATVVHALDAVFGFGALFALAALVTVLVGIQGTRAAGAVAVPSPRALTPTLTMTMRWAMTHASRSPSWPSLEDSG